MHSEILENCLIEAWGGQGTGVFRFNSRVVRVPFTVPGERCVVRVTIDDRNRIKGELIDLLEKSPDRSVSDCPQATWCPGCQIRQLNYQKQLEWKRSGIKRLLKKQPASAGIQVEPCISHPETRGYRTRGVFRVFVQNGQVGLGMKDFQGSTRIVDLSMCPNHHPDLNIILEQLKVYLTEWVHKSVTFVLKRVQ